MRSPRARREGAVETGSSTAVRGSRLVSFADGWGRGRRKPLKPFVLAHRDGSPTTLCQLSAPNFSRLPAWMTAATTLHLPPFFFFFHFARFHLPPMGLFRCSLTVWIPGAADIESWIRRSRTLPDQPGVSPINIIVVSCRLRVPFRGGPPQPRNLAQQTL